MLLSMKIPSNKTILILLILYDSSQRERRALQRVAQSLGVQFQYERAVRGQLEEQEVVMMLDTIAVKDAELKKAQDELQRATDRSARYDLLSQFPVLKMLYYSPSLLILLPLQTGKRCSASRTSPECISAGAGCLAPATWR